MNGTHYMQRQGCDIDKVVKHTHKDSGVVKIRSSAAGHHAIEGL